MPSTASAPRVNSWKSGRNRAHPRGIRADTAAAAKNNGLRRSLANSHHRSLSNALTPCDALEVVLKGVLIEMGVGHHQPRLHEPPHRRAGVQAATPDGQ